MQDPRTRTNRKLLSALLVTFCIVVVHVGNANEEVALRADPTPPRHLDKVRGH